MAWLFDETQGTARVYFGTDTRVAALLVGIFVAAISRRPLRREETEAAASAPAADILGWSGMVVLGLAWATLGGDEPSVYRGGLFALAWAGAAVVAAPVWSRTGTIARAFSFAPLRWLGTISYGHCRARG